MIIAVKPLIQQLPKENMDVLSYLIHFLTLVVSECDKNLMGANNCAMVFAPSLLKKPETQNSKEPDQMAMLKAAQNLVLEMEHSQKIIRTLIVGYDSIFLMVLPNSRKNLLSFESKLLDEI
eukprot:TRINITY_DN7852_c0_g1_i1.p1 TRINITY_DN7852_c0_g1~~TRINITY_DN7852_c0_g1_i1.p1  ORF type:complete len:121 (+),score=17.06 TRINITY_DN7852_c0_g1_i1:56-418(+)